MRRTRIGTIVAMCCVVFVAAIAVLGWRATQPTISWGDISMPDPESQAIATADGSTTEPTRTYTGTGTFTAAHSIRNEGRTAISITDVRMPPDQGDAISQRVDAWRISDITTGRQIASSEAGGGGAALQPGDEVLLEVTGEFRACGPFIAGSGVRVSTVLIDVDGAGRSRSISMEMAEIPWWRFDEAVQAVGTCS